ncbi:MAG TPA: hypothetical protein VIJ57_13030 [Hanamia sp.]
MKIKTKNIGIACCFVVFILGSCGKRNFFPDENNPGLSRLTSRGYNIATMYVNGTPYINTYKKQLLGGVANSVPIVTLISTGSIADTLSIYWEIERNDSSSFYNQSYHSISLLMPVPKNFTSNDFLAMTGQRFANNNNVITLNSFVNYPDSLHGASNIYFVKIQYINSPATSAKAYAFSGLFDGNIGDSISITKGRFDFEIDASQIKF